MAAKQGGFGKLLSIVFTAILAPITVNLTVRRLESDIKLPIETPAIQTVHSPSTLENRLIVEGVGGTPEEALRLALRNAVHIYVSQLVPQNHFARERVIEGVMQNCDGLVEGFQDLKTCESWQGWRKVCCKTVAVHVSREALTDRLASVTASSR